MNMIDLTGQQIPDSRWTVIERAENTTSGQAQWLCQCECGNRKVLKSILIRRGISRSCGCLKSEELAERNSIYRYAEGHGRPAPAINRGDVFGRLTVVQYGGTSDGGHYFYDCRCICGNFTTVLAMSLRNGQTKSCGCLALSGEAQVKHGHKRGSYTSKAYECWTNMKRRCKGTNSQRKDYYLRGITYDPRWESFENFLEDMGEPPPGLSLDRKDNDGPYCKDNCRWATRLMQNRNRTDTIPWTNSDGETMSLHEAVERYSSVPFHTVDSRIRNGWDPRDAVFKPKQTEWRRGPRA